MSSTRYSRLRDAALVAALLLAMLALLPSPASADHGGWTDCFDSATADVDESSTDTATAMPCVVPVYSGGGESAGGGTGGYSGHGTRAGGAPGRLLTGPGCPAGGGGGGGVGAGDVGIDSGTADVDTSAAQIDAPFSTSGLPSRGGAWSRATSYGCDRGVGRIGDAGDGAVPTRIDAGAGGAATASGAQAALAVLTGLAAAGVGALRRRRR